MKKFLLFLTGILICNSYPQEKIFELFPPGLNFKPLKSDNRKADIGLIFIPQNNNMKIDIGNTVDLVSLRLSDSEILTVGIEFLAYALSRSYRGKRLQIDAVDGFFGGNFSYSKKMKGNSLAGRLSIIHNSAHLVDGHWDFHNNKWIDDYKPVPYSRDFLEFIASYSYNIDFISIKNYAGIEYAFLTRPSDIKRFFFDGGIEIGLGNLSSSLLGKEFAPFLAYDFLLSGSQNYIGSSNLLLGIKFGSLNEKGLLIFLSYYQGLDVFHAYYKRKVERFGIGFSLDFL
jgi:hypothetical protein